MIEVSFTIGSEPVEDMHSLTSAVHRYTDPEAGSVNARRDEKPFPISSGMSGLPRGVYTTTFENGSRWEFEWDGAHIMERVRDLKQVSPFLTDAPNKAVLVYPWKDAPDTFRQWSTHGGDEDWVIYFPPSFDMSFDGIPAWVDALCVHGAPDMMRYSDGGFLVIAAHA